MTGASDPSELSDQNEEQTLEYRMREELSGRLSQFWRLSRALIIFPVRLEGTS